VRWIDLGCPIDFDYDPSNLDRNGFGWAGDDKRPTLTITEPKRGANSKLSRILIGIDDYYSGLDFDSFIVTCDFDVNGIPAGENLAPHFQKIYEGVYELPLTQLIELPGAPSISVSIKDRQGSISRIVRTFSHASEEP
jgi:hypothetical protein